MSGGYGNISLRAELRRDGDWVEYVVDTNDGLYANRLVKMGWRSVDTGRFTRRLSASPDVTRIFERFSRHLETMILQSARRLPAEWDTALETFIDRVSATGTGWWLYGSGALAVRGMDVVPGDLDLAVDDPWVVGEALGDLLVEPVTRMTGWVADAGGRAFHGAIIEWLAGAHATGLDPPNEQEPAARNHLEQVRWRGHAIAVPTLELQLAVAARRGLLDRCALIRTALQNPQAPG